MSDIDDDYLGQLDEYDRDDDTEPRETRCRDCNSADVYWAQNNAGRWVLYDLNSRVHRCKQDALTERRLDAFDNLD